MKGFVLGLFAVLLLVPVAFAITDLEKYSIQDTLSLLYAKASLGDNVKLYFGNQPHKKVVKDFGIVRTMKRTNGVGKSDMEACQRSFVSGLVALQHEATKRGGNAVINIKTIWKNQVSESADTFECGAGTLMAGMTVTGTVVQIEE